MPDSNNISQIPNEPKRFASDVIWVAGVQVLNSLVTGVITFPFLTKSYNAEIFGIWNQINLTMMIMASVLTLQLGLAVVRFLAAESDRSRRQTAMGSMLSAVLAFNFLALIVANLFAPQISSLLFASPDYILLTRLTFLWVFTASLFNFFGSFLRSRNKIKLLSGLQILFSISTMILIITLSTTGFGLEWIITSIILAQAVFVFIFAGIVIRDSGVPIPNISGLSGYLAFCAPQIPGNVLLWIINFSDRYFITHLLGLTQAGIYTPSFNLASLTALFYTPITYVLFPVLTRLWEEKRHTEVQKYIEYSNRLFLTMAIPAALGLALLSQPLLKYLATSEFLAGKALVLLISIGVIFQGVYYINVNAVYLLKKTRFLPLMISGAALTSVVLNIILIPRIGLLGSALSNIAAYSVLVVITIMYARSIIKLDFNYKYFFKVICAALVMGACLYFFPVNGIPELILAIFLGAIVFILGLFLLKAFSEQDRQLIRGILDGFTHKRNTIRG